MIELEASGRSRWSAVVDGNALGGDLDGVSHADAGCKATMGRSESWGEERSIGRHEPERTDMVFWEEDDDNSISRRTGHGPQSYQPPFPSPRDTEDWQGAAALCCNVCCKPCLSHSGLDADLS